jgi:ABC-type nitrate/sulfonate/bicarbonate transport system substrate-binding protein
VTGQFDRRTFLHKGGIGLGGSILLGGSLLAACGGDDDTASSGGGGSSSGGGETDLGTLDYQLSWIKNVEFAGEYIADDKGYYADGGFSKVNFIAGGPDVQQDSVVNAGRALVGVSSPDITGPAILQGAKLVAIGAIYQKNPFAVMSLKSKPIKTAEEMKGKKIGVQAVNEPIWNAFLKANDIKASDVDKVPVQFDPQPLVAGDVDGWFSFFTNEPNLLRKQGVATEVFLLADQNYPLVSEIQIVRTDSLTDDAKRAKVKAALLGDIKGWRASVKDPGLGAKLAVENYGKSQGLDEQEQTWESQDQNTLVLTDDTKTNGLFTITDELIDASLHTLSLGGVTIAKDKLFDLSLLAEVYDENPDLKASPV